MEKKNAVKPHRSAEIRLLSEEVISKIAAGEVIERPASVLKELLENSIDAGAKTVHIDIEKAGKKLIRVHDDGRGMAQWDVSLCVLRHATSKIRDFEDLDTLRTFGFRGEALYSIAAVSRMTIASCRKTPESSGWQISLEGTKLLKECEAPPVPGTTVEVRDLFFNTPARIKFMKSDPSERAHLLRAAEECALANIETAFHVRADGTDIYSLPAGTAGSGQSLRERVGEILGREVSSGMIYAEGKSLDLKAFASDPGAMLSTRTMQFFFINRRPVASRVLQQALYRAYADFRGKDRHPACVLYLELPPSEFDVNIHPQKKDVRFTKEGEIFNIVSRAIGDALLKCRKPVEIAAPETPESFERTAPPPEQFAGFADSLAEIAPARPAELRGPAQIPAPEAGREPEGAVPAWWRPPYNYVGQVERSYLVFESGEGMIIIDQHAAQERVLFEQYIDQLAKFNPAVQRLMLPLNAELSASELQHIMQWKDYLHGAGFEIEQAGPRNIHVHAVPALFEFTEAALGEFLRKLAEVLGDPAKCSDELKHKTLATFACKKAVKANEPLSPKEAAKLLLDLKQCRDGLACPHGRPTMISISKDELARKFQRPRSPSL